MNIIECVILLLPSAALAVTLWKLMGRIRRTEAAFLDNMIRIDVNTERLDAADAIWETEKQALANNQTVLHKDIQQLKADGEKVVEFTAKVVVLAQMVERLTLEVGAMDPENLRQILSAAIDNVEEYTNNSINAARDVAQSVGEGAARNLFRDFIMKLGEGQLPKQLLPPGATEQSFQFMLDAAEKNQKLLEAPTDEERNLEDVKLPEDDPELKMDARSDYNDSLPEAEIDGTSEV